MIYEDLPSETKKMFWNFSCSFDIAQQFKTQKKQIPVFLDSIFFSDPNRRRKFSFSFLTRDQQVVFIKWIFGFLFEHQFNYLIEFCEIIFCEVIFFSETCGNMKITFGMWVEKLKIKSFLSHLFFEPVWPPWRRGSGRGRRLWGPGFESRSRTLNHENVFFN